MYQESNKGLTTPKTSSQYLNNLFDFGDLVNPVPYSSINCEVRVEFEVPHTTHTRNEREEEDLQETSSPLKEVKRAHRKQ